jgi:hypothetical protein
VLKPAASLPAHLGFVWEAFGHPVSAVSQSTRSSGRKLRRDFYARPALTVARERIGKFLVHSARDGENAGRIVEAEAYQGSPDLAVHSSRD